MTSLLYEPWINLRSGGKWFYLEPERSTFTIEDIAFGLSNECRWGGQIEFYSVSEHSIQSCIRAKENEKLEHLLHDAIEFVMKDMMKPLKEILPEYKVLENLAKPIIERKFGLDPSVNTKPIDLILQKAEAIEFFADVDKEWIHQYNTIEDDVTFNPLYLTPKESRAMFLDLYEKHRRI